LASPHRRIAASPHRRIAASPHRRIAASPHRHEFRFQRVQAHSNRSFAASWRIRGHPDLGAGVAGVI
jgi:hypothetical protein